MKVLIIGNRFHQFIYNYVNALRNNSKRGEFVVDVLSQESSDVSFQSDYVYDTIYALKINAMLRKNRFTRILAQQFAFRNHIKNLTEYDIVHIHYVENIILRDVAYFSRHIKGKLVVSIWGSDFLRATDRQRKQLLVLFKRADRITIASEVVIQMFREYYKGCSFLSKVILCRFGLEPLEKIIPILESCDNKDYSKRLFGLSEDKLVVTIGYNASRLQHHLEIIESINEYFPLLGFTDKIEFLLPLTYPIDEMYVDEIRKKTNQSRFKFVIITDFLSDDKIAHLRIASDIFVQLQPTDMLSGSMLEHLSTGNLVITGSWLPYDCLNDWNVFLYKIDKLDAIAVKLYEVLCDYSVGMEKCIKNKDVVFQRFRWKNVINDWINLYYA